MKIFTYDDPVLRKHSVLVSNIDRGTRDFIDAMFDTLYSEKGIGLAAVQVGHLQRLFVVHLPDDVPRVFINPEILETSLEVGELEEGCLSIPGLNADVSRPAVVKIQAWNANGKSFRLTAENLLARVVQHELDHLNGRLFVDHLQQKKRDRLLKSYKNQVHA